MGLPTQRRARRQGLYFLIERGHELDAGERVVEDNGRFLTVEKTVQTGFIAESDSRSSARGQTR